MGHREDIERTSQAVREASAAHARALRERNEAIVRARGDRVEPAALQEWAHLSPEHIRRICEDAEKPGE